MRLRFFTCDVFTRLRFRGNPLAVLPEAEGLSTQQMQQIAREFNFSETTFVLPPSDESTTQQLRIFTPQEELPFAGHPNIGTAFVLAKDGRFGTFDTDETKKVVFEEEAGLVPITIRKTADNFHAELKAPQDIELGAENVVSLELMAKSLSISPDDIVTSHHLPRTASAGFPFLFVEVKDRPVLERVKTDTQGVEEIASLGIVPFLHVYTRCSSTDDDFDIRCRMFAPLEGIPEDPATGSANCALAGLLTQIDDSKDSGDFSWTIAQGVEMNRPSCLYARTSKQNGKVTGIWIAGECAMVTEGTIEVD